MNAEEAKTRGIGKRSLIKVFKQSRRSDLRGIAHPAAAARRRPWLQPSAVYDPMGEPGKSVDRGGCLNLLTPERTQTKSTHSLAGADSLVQIELWDGRAEFVLAAFAAADKDRQVKRRLPRAAWCRRNEIDLLPSTLARSRRRRMTMKKWNMIIGVAK